MKPPPHPCCCAAPSINAHGQFWLICGGSCGRRGFGSAGSGMALKTAMIFAEMCGQCAALSSNVRRFRASQRFQQIIMGRLCNFELIYFSSISYF